MRERVRDRVRGTGRRVRVRGREAEREFINLFEGVRQGEGPRAEQHVK